MAPLLIAACAISLPPLAPAPQHASLRSAALCIACGMHSLHTRLRLSSQAPGGQVLMEIAGETLEQLAGSAAPQQQKQRVAQAQAAAGEEEDEALRARLDAVRS